MKKIVFTVMTISLLSCIKSSNIEDSSGKESAVILNINELASKQIGREIFVSKNSNTGLTFAMDDDREL